MSGDRGYEETEADSPLVFINMEKLYKSSRVLTIIVSGKTIVFLRSMCYEVWAFRAMASRADRLP